MADAISGTVSGIREHDYRDLPREWASGLRRLNTMDMPQGAKRDRWAELVLDAHRFAWTWHDVAIEHGWTLDTLFAFNPGEPYQSEAGLAFSIRGGRIVSLFRDHRHRSVAAIGGGDRCCRYFYQRPVVTPQLVWNARTIA